MKDRLIIASLALGCVAFLLLALYFKKHQEKIIVNLIPVGNNSGWVSSPYEFK